MYAMMREQIIGVAGKKSETSKYEIAYTNDMESASTYIKTCYETELRDLGNKFTIYNKVCFDTWYMICFRLAENTVVIDKLGIEWYIYIYRQ